MPEAGHYGYKKTDGICDGVSPARPPPPCPIASFPTYGARSATRGAGIGSSACRDVSLPRVT
nr:unnamed protein product [Digitaria exilis]